MGGKLGVGGTTDRRAFLAKVGACSGAVLLGGLDVRASAASRLRAGGPSGPGQLDRIGLQLYTVRSLMSQDPAALFDAVAAIGYREVEFAGYFGHAPSALRGWLDNAGLAAPAAHVGADDLAGPGLDSALEAASALGHRWLVLPWIPENQRTEDGYRSVAAMLNAAGAQAQEAGVRVAYHNHAFEFEPVAGSAPDGPSGFDVLLDTLDPSLAQIEIDFHWAVVGGADPVRLLDEHPGRFALCHLKDIDAQGRMTDVGEGIIDWAAIFARADQAGIRGYFVEHDAPPDPMASVEASFRYLSAVSDVPAPAAEPQRPRARSGSVASVPSFYSPEPERTP